MREVKSEGKQLHLNPKQANAALPLTGYSYGGRAFGQHGSWRFQLWMTPVRPQSLYLIWMLAEI